MRREEGKEDKERLKKKIILYVTCSIKPQNR